MRFVVTFALVTGMAFGATLTDPDPSQIDQIIAKFAAKEAAFAKARSNYTYRQTAKVETLDDGGGVTGRWQEVSEIIFLEGARVEKVTYAPPNTLTAISLDPGDIQDLRSVQPFVLTTEELPKYYIRYLGREQLDEISTYAFAVKPKSMESGQRYFEGIVWVDDRDLQIVKSYGRGEGRKQSADHQYGKFETYREQVDGKFWFPTYTISNATLHFRENDQRIRMTVKYQDYKQFKSDVNIKYDVEDPDKKPDATTPPPNK
jgi:hypothetical protein